MLRVSLCLVCLYVALALLAGCTLRKPSDFAWKKQDPQPSPQALDGNINASTYFTAGTILEQQCAFEKAAVKYQQALQLDPSSVQTYNHLGVVYGKLGQYKEAEDCFKRALERWPNQPYLRNNLAFNYILQRDYRSAEAELKNALALDPNFKRARMNLAIVQAKLDRYDDALKTFEEVCSPCEAAYNIALLYQAAGKYTEATTHYQRTLTLNPNFQPAQKALAALAKPREAATGQPADVKTN